MLLTTFSDAYKQFKQMKISLKQETENITVRMHAHLSTVKIMNYYTEVCITSHCNVIRIICLT